jgi:hypothetical protein
MTGQPGRSGGKNDKSGEVRYYAPTTARAPAGLSRSGKDMWTALVAGGGVTDSDVPLMKRAFIWYKAYESASEKFAEDCTCREARIAAKDSWIQFTSTIKLIGCDPARMKSKPLPKEERLQIEEDDRIRTSEANKAMFRRPTSLTG